MGAVARVRDLVARAITCTLTPADQTTRLAALRAIRRDALLDESRDGFAWTTLWRRSDAVRGRLEALIKAEKECCPFLTFEVEELEGVIRVRTLFPRSTEGLLQAE